MTTSKSTKFLDICEAISAAFIIVVFAAVIILGATALFAL